MCHRLICPIAVAIMFTGCVPVAAPLSDPTKAEPDRELIGKWESIQSKSDPQTLAFCPKSLGIKIPQDPATPKGQMLAEWEKDNNPTSTWIFTTKIGKHNYATIFWSQIADFIIVKYTVNGGDLVLDFGNDRLVERIMSEEKIDLIEMPMLARRFIDHTFLQYNTPKKWLANYLRKNGPEKIFDGKYTVTYRLLKRDASASLFPWLVPVTEPLSDAAKAEPDKTLFGKWERDGRNGSYEIDTPVVKGNPSSLMRAIGDGKPDSNNTFWFFATKLGKHTFATIYIHPEDSKFADFMKEGEFERLARVKERKYFVVKYSVDGDKLVLDGGGDPATEYLLSREKIAQHKTNGFFKTPEGWLSEYLTTNGPNVIYDGTAQEKYIRAKK